MERSLHKGLHKVKCRVCKKEVNYQGYKEHLETQHPDENPGDMRDFNQPTLFGGLKQKKVGEDKEKIKEEMDEEEKQGEEKEEDEEEEKDEGVGTEQGDGEIQKAAGELKIEAVDMWPWDWRASWSPGSTSWSTTTTPGDP